MQRARPEGSLERLAGAKQWRPRNLRAENSGSLVPAVGQGQLPFGAGGQPRVQWIVVATYRAEGEAGSEETGWSVPTLWHPPGELEARPAGFPSPDTCCGSDPGTLLVQAHTCRTTQTSD